MGTALAGKVMELIGTMSEAGLAAEPALLASAAETIELPSRPLPTADEAEALAAGDNRMWLGDELAERLLDSRKSYPAELQALRLGNTVLAGIPGEPFCRMGKAIRDLAAPLTGIPVGYANGYVGYIVPPESWARGGYEVDPGPWSKVAPESHTLILDTLNGLFKKIGA